MMSKRQNILILKSPPRFSKAPARPFKNYCLGGIARPNILYVPKFATHPNLREVEKVMSQGTNAIGDMVAKNPKKPQKEKAIPRSKPPIIPNILKGGAKKRERNQEQLEQVNPQKRRKYFVKGNSSQANKNNSPKSQIKQDTIKKKGEEKIEKGQDGGRSEKKEKKIRINKKDIKNQKKENIQEKQKVEYVKEKAEPSMKKREEKEKEENEIEQAEVEEGEEGEKDDENEEEEEIGMDEEEEEDESESEDEEEEEDEDNETEDENKSTDSESDALEMEENSLANALMHPLKVFAL